MRETSLNHNLRPVRGHLLARNVVWNLLGLAAPLLVAVPAVPRLIRGVGIDRFGVLTLAWVVIGYFSLFDFGFGRALTKLVAEKLGAGRTEDIPPLFWTSLVLMLLFGGLGAAVMAVLSPWLVHSVLRIPATIQVETLRAFYVLAASVPVVIATTALRGFLEAYQRFRASTAVRIPLGVFTFAGPLLVLPFSANLLPIVGILVLARLLACIALWVLCVRTDPALSDGIVISWDLVSLLFRFGGWMTVTSIVSPLMASLDRFLIGAVVSISAVAYYATPSEVVIKLLIIPSAIAGVLFPAFSSGFAQDTTRTRLLFVRGVKYTFLAIFPFILIVIVFASEGLRLWVGAEFARHSTAVLQLLTIGVFFNGISNTPFALVQGVGRPDITGKLHLIELPAYVILLWFLVTKFGIVGAAIAWTTRVTLDSVLLFLVAGRLLPGSAPGIRKMLLSSLGALFVLILSALPVPLPIKLIFLLLASGVFGLATWFVVLTPAEKAYIWNRGSSSLAAS